MLVFVHLLGIFIMLTAGPDILRERNYIAKAVFFLFFLFGLALTFAERGGGC